MYVSVFILWGGGVQVNLVSPSTVSILRYYFIDKYMFVETNQLPHVK